MHKCNGRDCQERHDALKEAFVNTDVRAPVLTHGNGECWHVAVVNENYGLYLYMTDYKP